MKFRLFTYLLFCVFSLPAQQSIRVQELEKERLAALDEIKETNRLLKENTLTISNALNRLNLLSQQITSRKKIVQLLDQEITSLDEEINFKEKQILSLEKDFETKKQYYAASIRKMYLHKSSIDNLLFIFSSQSFSQSFHRMMYLKAYFGWQKKQAEEIVKKENTINREKNQLIAQRKEKLNLLNERQSEENQLAKEEENKKNEVDTLEKDKKKLQDDLAKKEKQAKALNQQIDKIIAEETLKSEKAAKSQGGGKRKAEVKGGYAMTESEQALSSTFAGNKGRLPFPLQGSYRIVGYFGVHPHKELRGVSTKNNGIDIETNSGNEARAVFKGVVSQVFTFRGYSNCIIIRHGNYLTLYSNIDQVYVKQGDNVNTGQTLGKIYTDNENGSTLLHFEIRQDQTKLDPLNWIKN